MEISQEKMDTIVSNTINETEEKYQVCTNTDLTHITIKKLKEKYKLIRDINLIDQGTLYYISTLLNKEQLEAVRADIFKRKKVQEKAKDSTLEIPDNLQRMYDKPVNDPEWEDCDRWVHTPVQQDNYIRKAIYNLQSIVNGYNYSKEQRMDLIKRISKEISNG